MAPVVGAAQFKLTLSPTELWAVHHVLLDCITKTHPGTCSPRFPPGELRDALEKIEDGKSQFTTAELRIMRVALQDYLRGASQTSPDMVAVGRAIDQITDALV